MSHCTITFARLLILLVVCSTVRAQTYLCADGSGRTYRLHQNLDYSLVGFSCKAQLNRTGTDGEPMVHAIESAPISIVFPAFDSAVREVGPDVRNVSGSGPGHRTVPNASSWLLALIDEVAHEYGIDPYLIMAFASVESAFDPAAISSKGAVGLMQVMPKTASRFGFRGSAADLFDPANNLRIGARYLAHLAVRFRGDLDLIIAAYNAGEQAVERCGKRVPPFQETRAYLSAVRHAYARYSSGDGGTVQPLR
ncbi:lytic transglycosylase domain-containing protein [Burkholderia diffusa]|uniref:lytic transglycosylase domain-containing protein n=1 Tax=Burkholderia diffusa TaxID=488732 RepID=UPI0007541271|nr:lytic transglycosylase domain-containing protein [Burkholderia diffusa]KVM90585.1 hypothetical protein WJ62_03005 [Burkholderia diffusa]